MEKKILVADDDTGTREFYKAAFESEGFTVQSAPDATAAIIACEDFKPDMLLLDWDMPGGGGKMVFEKICGLLGKQIPVLFITGSPQLVDVDAQAGKIAVLKKPASAEAILANVAQLLK